MSLIGKGTTRKKTISRVAFGENDAWIVIFTNGACPEWNGPVPEALVAGMMMLLLGRHHLSAEKKTVQEV